MAQQLSSDGTCDDSLNQPIDALLPSRRPSFHSQSLNCKVALEHLHRILMKAMSLNSSSAQMVLERIPAKTLNLETGAEYIENPTHAVASVDATLGLAHELLPHHCGRVQRDAGVTEQQEPLVARLLERLPQQLPLDDARVGAAPLGLRAVSVAMTLQYQGRRPRQHIELGLCQSLHSQMPAHQLRQVKKEVRTRSHGRAPYTLRQVQTSTNPT